MECSVEQPILDFFIKNQNDQVITDISQKLTDTQKYFHHPK